MQVWVSEQEYWKIRTTQHFPRGVRDTSEPPQFYDILSFRYKVHHL